MSFQDNFKGTYSLPPNTPYKKRLKHALLATGHDPTWDRIDSCCKDRRCGSYYCDSCRTGACKSQASSTIRLHRELHGADDAQARRNIQSVTILHDLVAPGHKNGNRYNDFSEVGRSVRSLRRKLNRIKKTFPGLLMVGRIELEVVNTKSILNSSQCVRKSSVIRHMMEGKLYGDDNLVLVHVHFFLFLNGNDLEKVKSCFCDKWQGKYMVEVKSTYDTKTTEDNIKSLCNYYAKNRYQFNHTMETDGYKEGKLFCNDILSYIVRLHLHLGILGLVIWSKRL